MKALITGGEGGLGRAMRARLEREGYEVESLDLVNGFVTTQHGEPMQQLISRDRSVAPGLLDRTDLLQMLDRACERRLRHVALSCGLGEAQTLADSQEIPNLMNLHTLFLSRS